MIECVYDLIHCDVCDSNYDAPHQPPGPSRREKALEELLREMVIDYHQTGGIRDHVDPNAQGWDVNKDWHICDDVLCEAARDLLG